ncbi:MAG: hypothetical protein ACAI43_09265 [Phycisphaerae bacterium]
MSPLVSTFSTSATGLAASRLRLTHHRQNDRTTSRYWLSVTGPTVPVADSVCFASTGVSRHWQNESAVTSPRTRHPHAAISLSRRLVHVYTYIGSRPGRSGPPRSP